MDIMAQSSNMNDIRAMFAGHITQEQRRAKRTMSFGSIDECKAILRFLITECDKTIKSFKWLPAYDEVAKWMSNTEGKGLLLTGEPGLGKTNILSMVVPTLIRNKTKLNVNVIPADQLTKPCKRTIPSMPESPCNLDYLVACPFPIIDDVGTESVVNNYGEKFDPVQRVVAAAEKDNKALFISTNLSVEELIRRYDVRTADRMQGLCKVVEFKGYSLR